MDLLVQMAAWLNGPANALGRFLLAPVGWLPGWLSATIISAVTGVLLLVIFKYTSNQRAIKRVRDDIKAHLLALKLFKDSTSVTFRAQGRILLGAFRLMVLSIVPMLVMMAPVCLLLGQLALWYQSRPLRVGEEAVVTVKLGGDHELPWPEVRLAPTSAVEVAVGDGFMRLSAKRPGWSWSDILLHPWERPFRTDSSVESIEIDYPDRVSWTSGTDWWVAYWFVASTVAALCFRPLLNVNI